LYRAWSAIRFAHLRQWAEEIAHEAIMGTRPNRSCQQVTWPLLMRLEQAMATGESIVGLILDLEKYFDGLDRELLYEVAKRAGMPPSVVQAVAAFYEGNERFLSYAGTQGPAFTASRSMYQGDSLTLLFVLLQQTVWAHTMTVRVPSAKISVVVDDRGITAETMEDLQAAATVTAEYDQASGSTWNTAKSGYWSINAGEGEIMGQGNVQLKHERSFRALGVGISTIQKPNTKVHAARMPALKAQSKRICHTAIPVHTRPRLLAALQKGRFAFGSDITQHSKLQKKQALAGTVRAV
jgi:hypothetical protein